MKYFKVTKANGSRGAWIIKVLAPRKRVWVYVADQVLGSAYVGDNFEKTGNFYWSQNSWEQLKDDTGYFYQELTKEEYFWELL